MARAKVQDVKMDDWSDWFENCGKLISPMQTFEDTLWSYYMTFTAGNTDEASSLYIAHHNVGEYKNDGVFSKYKIKGLAISAFIGLLIGFAAGFLWRLISKNKDGIMFGVIFGLVFCVLISGVYFLLNYLKLSNLRSQLSKQEDALYDRIQYIPPKYRNSIALDFVYSVYLNQSGVITFLSAFNALDEWFASLPVDSDEYVGRLVAVMFDVPYTSDTDDDTNDRESVDFTIDEAVLNNPALPSDIRNKTFSGFTDASERLNSLVGLTDVKHQVNQMKNRMEFSNSAGSMDKISGNHMCFLGSPGTGKTTVARIITGILYDFGYIKDNKCVETDGSYFKSPHIGETAARTQAIIDYAMGGVLFIDEAYLMMDENSNVGVEATGTILKNMEDRQHDFVVIFAGYEDSVNRLLNTNEGFASRIKHKIYFDDFSVDELMQIFDGYLSSYSGDSKYTLEENAKSLLKAQFAKEKESPTFGNARVVRTAFDAIMDAHADHFMNHEIPEDKKFVFVSSDIQAYVDNRTKQLDEDSRNYIASQNLDNSVISFNELKGHTKEGSLDPDKDLASLAGLDVVKNEIKEMKAQFEFYGGNMGDSEGHHMCFIGPAGTGKSTVAGIMTAYLYQMGIIKRNEYLDINGDFLRGMYLGHTGKRTQAVVQYCQGMVLFLDESYLLYNGDNGGDNFGQEAIGVLLDAMEKNRKDFVVIFAGYEKEMDEFLNANSGLRSRISKTFHFTQYTPHELAKMMNHMAKKEGFKIEKDVWVPVQKYVHSKLDDPYFGNARFIRSFWQDVKKQHIVNYSESGDESKKYVITLDDVNMVFGRN